jgi:hypothetical protein
MCHQLSHASLVFDYLIFWLHEDLISVEISSSTFIDEFFVSFLLYILLLFKNFIRYVWFWIKFMCGSQRKLDNFHGFICSNFVASYCVNEQIFNNVCPYLSYMLWILNFFVLVYNKLESDFILTIVVQL